MNPEENFTNEKIQDSIQQSSQIKKSPSLLQLQQQEESAVNRDNFKKEVTIEESAVNRDNFKKQSDILIQSPKKNDTSHLSQRKSSNYSKKSLNHRLSQVNINHKEQQEQQEKYEESLKKLELEDMLPKTSVEKSIRYSNQITNLSQDQKINEDLCSQDKKMLEIQDYYELQEDQLSEDSFQYDLTQYSSNDSSNIGDYEFQWINEFSDKENVNINEQFNFDQNIDMGFGNSNTAAFFNSNKNPIDFSKFQNINVNSNPLFLQSFGKNNLLQSPQKSKPIIAKSYKKQLLCNNKPVPSWAVDKEEIVKISIEQQNLDTEKIFGKFKIDCLDLSQIFNDKKYDIPRGSSAKWEKTDMKTENKIDSSVLQNLRDISPNVRANGFGITNFITNSIAQIKKKLL